MNPFVAVGLGFVGFVGAIGIQLSRRRYVTWACWLTVVATVAMGTALSDLAAYSLHLGYLEAGLLFAVAIVVPAAGYRWLGWNAVATSWMGYVLTRPLGAAFADFMGNPPSSSGLGWGAGSVAAGLALVMAVSVAALVITGFDVQRPAVHQRRLLMSSAAVRGATPGRLPPAAHRAVRSVPVTRSRPGQGDPW